ncbi:J domain-containing protein-like [Dysidea avara]|uniref:J domain-containing protein-like n=1 Tax=Dysidea avara TaxID=196820 RepID=UPI00332F1F14
MASTNLFSSQEEMTYYELLGCDKSSTMDQIKAEFKVLVLRYHPDKTSGDESSRAHYLELQHAYDTLTNEEKRAQYDRWLDGGAIVPFETWMRLQSTHGSLHWGSSPRQPAALLDESYQTSSQKQDVTPTQKGAPSLAEFRVGHHGSSNAALNKFRSYKL